MSAMVIAGLAFVVCAGYGVWLLANRESLDARRGETRSPAAYQAAIVFGLAGTAALVFVVMLVQH